MKTKQLFSLIVIALFCALNTYAKKIEVTIDGTVYPSQTRLYLIVNEDTANAVLVPIEKGKFSVKVKVDQNAFIRLHDYKQWPERSGYVLIPDSKHITINLPKSTIEGSPMSKKLKDAMYEIRTLSPDGFHIDVFSDNPDDWAAAREKSEAIRRDLQMKQREQMLKTMVDNKDNNIPIWVYYCYKREIDMAFDEVLPDNKKQMKHPILQR